MILCLAFQGTLRKIDLFSASFNGWHPFKKSPENFIVLLVTMVEIEVLEFFQKWPQHSDVGKICGLLALHGINEHLVKHAQLLRIVLGVRLDWLSHEILAHDVPEFIRMVLFVHHPSHALIAVHGFLAPQSHDLV